MPFPLEKGAPSGGGPAAERGAALHGGSQPSWGGPGEDRRHYGRPPSRLNPVPRSKGVSPSLERAGDERRAREPKVVAAGVREAPIFGLPGLA